MVPSQSIIEASSRAFTAVDTRGRRLTFRRLTALDTLRLFKVAGPVLSQNEAWLAMSGLAFSVLEIDGIPVPAPVTEAQIEGLVEKLGDEGLAAVAMTIRDEEPSHEHQADVGNLPGTLS